jgi:hypothetical protein
MSMPMPVTVTTRGLLGRGGLAIVWTRVGVNQIGEQWRQHFEYLGAGLRVMRRATRPLQRERVTVQSEVKQRGRYWR